MLSFTTIHLTGMTCTVLNLWIRFGFLAFSCDFSSSLFWGIVQQHAWLFPSVFCPCHRCSFPAMFSLSGAEKTHICGVAGEWRECPVRAAITWEGLLPVQLCLTGTTTLVNELFINTCTYTQTQKTGDTDTSLFLDMRCSYCNWTEPFFLEGRKLQCYHDREKNILRVNTFIPPPPPQPPRWLLISNSWVTSWEICEWTVRPVRLSGSADFSPL